MATWACTGVPCVSTQALDLLLHRNSPGVWGKLLGDTMTATSILDRLLHHSDVANIHGKSQRLKNKR